MLENPPLSAPTLTELAWIYCELKAMLGRYRQCNPRAPAYVSAIADILRLHDYVWDAVALLRGNLPTTPPWAAVLTHLYQTRRDTFCGALSLCGLGEMIEFLEQLLADHGWHAAGRRTSPSNGLAPGTKALANHPGAHSEDPPLAGTASVDAQ
jgi:hypothetical protein